MTSELAVCVGSSTETVTRQRFTSEALNGAIFKSEFLTYPSRLRRQIVNTVFDSSRDLLELAM